MAGGAVRIELPSCVVRGWRPDDAAAIAPLADDREIWRNLRDAFPHPYTRADAEAFIARVATREPATVFCIEVGGTASGSIGYLAHADVERFTAEIGYWLGRPYWGRGIMTAALRAVTGHALGEGGLQRLYALPYAWNPASARVLEKAGYRREGTLRRHSFKDGVFVDQWLYAITRPDLGPAAGATSSTAR